MFGSNSSLSPLVGGGGGLVCESVGKADLLSDNFDNKPSREYVDLPITCHPSNSLITFAFRSSEVSDPLCMFPLFLKRTADVMAPRLIVVFRWADIGLSPASRETAQTNKPQKHYTKTGAITSAVLLRKRVKIPNGSVPP